MSVCVKLNEPISEIIKSAGINSNTIKFMTTQAKEYMSEFVPYDTGNLCNSAVEQISSETTGSVLYNKSYAAACYYGENLNFSKDKHSKATAFWDKAMIKVYGDELKSNVGNYIKRK